MVSIEELIFCCQLSSVVNSHHISFPTPVSCGETFSQTLEVKWCLLLVTHLSFSLHHVGIYMHVVLTKSLYRYVLTVPLAKKYANVSNLMQLAVK